MAGQIIPRGKNVWLVRLYLGRDQQGKRLYLNQTIHGPRKAAQAWLNQRLTERDAGVAVKPAQQTLNEYLDHWLEAAAKARVRPKTFYGYRIILQCHIRPALGARPLSKITPLEVQQTFQAMVDKGLSARTIEYTRMILKQAFKQAIQWRLLTFNPCEGAPIPRRERAEMQALSPEQARRRPAGIPSALGQHLTQDGLPPWRDVGETGGSSGALRSRDGVVGGISVSLRMACETLGWRYCRVWGILRLESGRPTDTP